MQDNATPSTTATSSISFALTPRAWGMPHLVATVLVVAGIWAVATLRFAAELWPLFPPGLQSVEGLKLAQREMSSGRELVLVLAPDGDTGNASAGSDVASSQHFLLQQLASRLRTLPEVASVEPFVRPGLAGMEMPGGGVLNAHTAQMLAAWVLINSPHRDFQKLVAKLTPEALAARGEEMTGELAGAPDAAQLLLLQVDPMGLKDIALASVPPSARPALERLEAALIARAIAFGDASEAAHGSTAAPAPGNQRHVPALVIRTHTAPQGFEACAELVAAVRKAAESELAAYQQHSSPAGRVLPRILLTGRPAFVAEISTQMRADMQVMIALATTLVALVFYAFYRSVAPLAWILLFIALSLLAGGIAARLIFGELNVLSMAFACIILGVGMDYCILVYHLHAMGLRTEQSWRALRRAIWLSAVTTAASFGVLWFSSFPGFQQLAVLIAAGLLTIAYFATTWLGDVLGRSCPVAPRWIDPVSAAAGAALERHSAVLRWCALAAVGLAVASAPWWMEYRFFNPALDRLEPSHSEALQAQRLVASDNGRNATDAEGAIIRGSWEQIRAALAQDLAKQQFVEGAIPPSLGLMLLLPGSGDEKLNVETWPVLSAQLFAAEMDKAGFEPVFIATTRGVLEIIDQWRAESIKSGVGGDPFGQMRSAVASLTSPAPDGTHYALAPISVMHAMQTADSQSVASASVLPVSWGLLKRDLSAAALRDVSRLSVFMLGAIVILCWIAHRSWVLVAINLMALAGALAMLGALLLLFRNSLSLMSLLAIPLLVGLVIDYSLHFVLELHHSGGSVRQAYRHLAVPVLLTGITTTIGFGAPIAGNQPALQNLGFVMDLGIAAAVATALVLVPILYGSLVRPAPSGSVEGQPHYSRSMYRASLFQLGSALATWLPLPVLRWMAGTCGWSYAALRPDCTERVTQNLALLSPSPRPDPAELRRAARQTYRQFGMALADYFAMGVRPRAASLATISQREGYEHLEAAHKAGRGAILVTGHLGLFELGGLMMHEFGFRVAALTLPEPSPELTEWRAAYRARWGVETVELGSDAFVYVQLMKHLREGKFIAVLIDRPRDAGRTVAVPFPGGAVPFSTGPAMLAALAGCPLIATACVRRPDGTHALAASPPIPVPAAGARDASVLDAATLQVADWLVPYIVANPSQWFQFVVPQTPADASGK